MPPPRTSSNLPDIDECAEDVKDSAAKEIVMSAASEDFAKDLIKEGNVTDGCAEFSFTDVKKIFSPAATAEHESPSTSKDVLTADCCTVSSMGSKVANLFAEIEPVYDNKVCLEHIVAYTIISYASSLEEIREVVTSLRNYNVVSLDTYNLVLAGPEALQKAMKRSFGGNMDLLSFWSTRQTVCSRYCREFVEQRLLGKGSFGAVYLCTNKYDGGTYAIKHVEVPKDETVHGVMREATTLSKISHRNIVRYFQAWVETMGPKSHVYIQMEFCSESLRTLLSSNTVPTTAFPRLVNAVVEVHKHGVIHGDISPSNVFFAEDIVKLGDFGLAKNAESVSPSKFRKGTKPYVPVETLSEKTDVFSLGMILFQLSYHADDKAPLYKLYNFRRLPKSWNHRKTELGNPSLRR